MFSPIVSAPLTCGTSSEGVPASSCLAATAAGVSASYWEMSAEVRAVKASRSSGVHQSETFPVPSKVEPWSSKPWPISWPMTAPMPA